MKDIGVFNLALLSKWKWKILEGKDCLWMEIFRARYENLQFSMLDEEGVSFRGFRSLWWKDIISLGRKRNDSLINKNCRFKVGN